MPQDVKTTWRRSSTGSRIPSQTGARAGERFETDAEVSAGKARQKFDTEMGWDGIGGAAKKPKGAEYDRRFSAWRDKQTKPPLPAISSREAADALAKRQTP